MASRPTFMPVARQIQALRRETEYDATIQQVQEDAQLRSGSRWALAFAILIASVGLNVNSTAVIIGAMHLFLINALFICLATLGFVRLMGFERVSEPEPEARRRMRSFISFLTLALVLPSIYTGWNVVQETRFNGAARRFIEEQLTFADRTQLTVALRYKRDSSMIDVTLIGEPLSLPALDSIRSRLPQYGLGRTRLLIRQPLGSQPSAEQIANVIRQGAFRDADARTSKSAPAPDPRLAALEAELLRQRAAELPLAPLTAELATLFPTLRSLSLGRVGVVGDTSAAARSVLSAVTTWRRLPARAKEERVRAFLALRLGRDSIRHTTVLER